MADSSPPVFSSKLSLIALRVGVGSACVSGVITLNSLAQIVTSNQSSVVALLGARQAMVVIAVCTLVHAAATMVAAHGHPIKSDSEDPSIPLQ